MKPNKQSIVDSIVLEIESGKSYSETFAVNGTKWQLSERTFAKYWNVANEAYKVILADRKKIFDAISTQNYIEAVERAVIDKNTKLWILEDIMTGKKEFEKVFIVQGKKETIMVKADASDVMRAIEIHNKMQGDNATEKAHVQEYQPTVIYGYEYAKTITNT